MKDICGYWPWPFHSWKPSGEPETLTRFQKIQAYKLEHMRPCGTVAAYRRGCRCDDCRRAEAERRSRYKRTA